MNRWEIQAARRGMGLTITEAAAAVGVGPETWRKWERGVGSPTPRSQERLRSYMGKHEAAVGRARVVLRRGGTLAVDTSDKLVVGAAGLAWVLERGSGRIVEVRETPPAG